MKKLLSILLSVVMLMLCFPIANADLMLQYDGKTVNYTGAVYDLTYNGRSISMPLAPIIFNDRALVPVRELFEAAGANVSYIESNNKQIIVAKDDLIVSMFINDNTAYVNGTKVNIPDGIAPKLINKVGESGKTMVPVRFISESIGLKVDFDGSNGVINISSADYVSTTTEPSAEPNNSSAVVISKVTTGEMSSGQLIATFTTGAAIQDFDAFALDNPSRLVIDVPGATTSLAETIPITKGGVTSIRVGDDGNRVRIVFDCNDVYKYDVSSLGEGKLKVNIVTASVVEATVSFGETVKTVTKTIKSLPQAVRGEDSLSTPTPSPTPKPSTSSPTPSAAPTSSASPTPRPTISPKTQSEYIVVLDAGHGGTDPGAIGTLDGKTINEKDLNLSITKKVESRLTADGINVKLSRPEDEFVDLAPRPNYANSIGAVLFVSVHINSAVASEAHGIETFYSSENNGTDYTLTSEDLATILLNHLIKETGATNRGVKQASHAVTRRSLMPASLCEVGFISNTEELTKMCTEDYQNKIAKAIADAIEEALPKLKWK